MSSADRRVDAYALTRGATPMQLKDLVRGLVDVIWEREKQAQRPVDDSMLTYVREAVVTELEHRRRVLELDRRLSELEGVGHTATAD